MKILIWIKREDAVSGSIKKYYTYLPISEKNIWLDKTIHRLFEIKRLKHILNNNEYAKNVILNITLPKLYPFNISNMPIKILSIR